MQRPRGCHSLEIAEVQRFIYVIRDAQVMLDRHLAALYGVEVKQLNRQVKRNIERFPADFMFRLSKEECSRCQIGTLNGSRGSNVKYLPYAFTENGILAAGTEFDSMRFVSRFVESAQLTRALYGLTVAERTIVLGKEK